MRISWLGHASFLIESGGSGLVTDPYDGIGLTFPEVSADVVTSSHGHFDHCATHLVAGEPVVVSSAGEHEIMPFRITGFPTFHDDADGSKRGSNIAFMIEAEGLRVCHLGDLGHALSDRDISALGRIDVLMIPVGGTYTIDSAVAAKVVESLQPGFVLPMHYKIKGLSLPIAGVVDFTNRFPNTSEADFLDLRAGELSEETEIVVLELKS